MGEAMRYGLDLCDLMWRYIPDNPVDATLNDKILSVFSSDHLYLYYYIFY
jgi:hypothetical protein